ncbi:MAG: stage II sporulation protein M [Anaerolineales bacterium]|uniref:Stage II sporulation protein M n=1 Tax=Candidatus Desulfolinea nitratireducens TaxID=2841698 RepID=A0A8J6TK86_9CHLR|nr:stage II sporulation protein M [Candidatus Desulfolinea nitratireducens]
MKEKLTPVWLLAQRELRDQFRDWRILFPLIVLTLLFPPLMNAGAGAAVSFMNNYGGDLILDRLVPFSILIIGFFPVTVSLVVALESFVGEKERGTIEPLLGTPFLDWQLYLGKLLVGIFFPLAASYLAIGLYLFMVSKQDLALPPVHQLVQLLTLTAAHAVLMVSGAIAISTQSTSVRAANLLASFIVMPVAFLIQGESVLLFWGNDQVLWLAVIAVLILAALLIRVGLAHFQREYLLGREIDSFKFKWIWQTFKGAFIGESYSPFKWYQVQVVGMLRKLKRPLLLIVVITIFGSIASYQWTTSMIPADFSAVTQEDIDEALDQFQFAAGLPSDDVDISFGFIFLHNIQAVLMMLFFGLFSFGVLGELAFSVNIGVLGGLMAVLNALGLPVWTLFTAGILPHGIFEIPAIIFAGAGILYFGAIMVTPDPTKTMGEVFIHAVADWFKIGVGVIFPLLLIAALIETFITPKILLSIMQ